MRKEIEDRLIDFSSKTNKLIRHLDGSQLSEHLSCQLIRSSSSAALNYGEALGAETRRDFTHKIGIVLKELRETLINLKIMEKSEIYKGQTGDLAWLIDECNQLVSIFHKTALTLKQKKK